MFANIFATISDFLPFQFWDVWHMLRPYGNYFAWCMLCTSKGTKELMDMRDGFNWLKIGSLCLKYLAVAAGHPLAEISLHLWCHNNFKSQPVNTREGAEFRWGKASEQMKTETKRSCFHANLPCVPSNWPAFCTSIPLAHKDLLNWPPKGFSFNGPTKGLLRRCTEDELLFMGFSGSWLTSRSSGSAGDLEVRTCIFLSKRSSIQKRESSFKGALSGKLRSQN